MQIIKTSARPLVRPWRRFFCPFSHKIFTKKLTRRYPIYLQPVHICLVCGHTVVDDLPEQCPICSTKKEMYKHF
ncbi:rubredoxin-like domain-containing protein [Heliorestis acidaminivorans]|uniref:rubredoxin-like domain-containing protein n=1 Tax=Heliorestis acidaminivorans TaxID=553427 RepID=UPI00311AAD74